MHVFVHGGEHTVTEANVQMTDGKNSRRNADTARRIEGGIDSMTEATKNSIQETKQVSISIYAHMHAMTRLCTRAYIHRTIPNHIIPSYR